jgi:CsoR family transcriptional regulator, copper-sensing transcriptional repressor
MEEKTLKDLILRLKKIEGQVRGIQRMLEKGDKTKSVITQISAIRSALDKVGFTLIAKKLKKQLSTKNIDPDETQDLKDIINLFMKLS